MIPALTRISGSGSCLIGSALAAGAASELVGAVILPLAWISRQFGLFGDGAGFRRPG